MTGFARAQGEHGGRNFVWEIKSVNARGLETRVRLPSGFDRLEARLKKALAKKISRGTVYISLSVFSSETESSFALNEAAFKEALSWVQKIQSEIDCSKPTPEGLLAVRGVVEQKDASIDQDMTDALDAALMASFDEAVSALAENRQAEGLHLSKALERQLAEIERLAALARENKATTLDYIREQIETQLADLLDNDQLSEERLNQEAAVLAIKADIREELDRLDGHVVAARGQISTGGAVGRRLDFLTQEFNREANTLCSKAGDMALKRTGLDLKTVVDQMREQVQNLE